MKTAVRLPIAIIFSETEILRQGGGMPKRWTQPRSTVSLLEKPTLRRLQQKRMNITAPSRAIPAIAAVRDSIRWAITKSLVMVFLPIKQDAVLPGGILLHTNFLRICSFLLCKHPYKFYLKIVSKKLLRDDL